MKLQGSFVASLCYLVTVLLLYLVGDVCNISWLQFAKGIEEKIPIQSLFPLILAIPVYVFVQFKAR